MSKLEQQINSQEQLQYGIQQTQEELERIQKHINNDKQV